MYFFLFVPNNISVSLSQYNLEMIIASLYSFFLLMLLSLIFSVPSSRASIMNAESSHTYYPLSNPVWFKLFTFFLVFKIQADFTSK